MYINKDVIDYTNRSDNCTMRIVYTVVKKTGPLLYVQITNTDQYPQFLVQIISNESPMFTCVTCEFWWNRVVAQVNFIANGWYSLLRTAPMRVVSSHTWDVISRKSSQIIRTTDERWMPVFLAIFRDFRYVWGAPSCFRTKSLTSLMFAAVREVFGRPLPHFRACLLYTSPSPRD